MKIFNWTSQPEKLAAWNKQTREVHDDGDTFYRVNGQLHRIDGPAVEYSNGGKEWHQHGLLHRLGGPAVEHSSGNKFWYKNGRIHRIDGPAVEWAVGDKRWWVQGEPVGVNSQAEFEQWLKARGHIK